MRPQGHFKHEAHQSTRGSGVTRSNPQRNVTTQGHFQQSTSEHWCFRSHTVQPGAKWDHKDIFINQTHSEHSFQVSTVQPEAKWDQTGRGIGS